MKQFEKMTLKEKRKHIINMSIANGVSRSQKAMIKAVVSLFNDIQLNQLYYNLKERGFK